MSRNKSIFVTVIVAVLLAIAIFAAYRLARTAFIITVAVLCTVGFLGAACAFCSWLEADSFRKEEAVEPPKVEPPSEWDYEQICDEVNKEAGR